MTSPNQSQRLAAQSGQEDDEMKVFRLGSWINESYGEEYFIDRTVVRFPADGCAPHFVEVQGLPEAYGCGFEILELDDYLPRGVSFDRRDAEYAHAGCPELDGSYSVFFVRLQHAGLRENRWAARFGYGRLWGDIFVARNSSEYPGIYEDVSSEFMRFLELRTRRIGRPDA